MTSTRESESVRFSRRPDSTWLSTGGGRHTDGVVEEKTAMALLQTRTLLYRQ